MLKKYFMTAALGIAILAGGYALPAGAQTSKDTPMESVAALPDGQTAVEGDWVDSREVNTVEESGIAKKMTQAEKAKNAEENDSWGGAITIIAMSIVIICLAVLSLLFMGFGKISQRLLTKKKSASKPKTGDASAASSENGKESLESGETIAAIVAALSQHFGGEHDMEDTILTIRRMKRAYSPWNSKIYNLRHDPGLHHHNPNDDALRHFSQS